MKFPTHFPIQKFTTFILATLILLSITEKIKAQINPRYFIFNKNVSFQSYQGTEETIKKYLDDNKNQLHSIEGIWSHSVVMSFNYVSSEDQGETKYAVIKDANRPGYFHTIILETSQKNWGLYGWYKYAIIAENQVTSYENAYVARIFPVKVEMLNWPHNFNVFIKENGILNYSYRGNLDSQMYVEYEVNAIRIFPNNFSQPRSAAPTKSTGTGFSVGNNCLIATCYHVVKGASTITIKGMNGNFQSSCPAEILQFDEVNDLAILKPKNMSCCSIPQTPYNLKSGIMDVGESVIVLGFPLSSVMGEEIKLTNGIVSSKTGFKGSMADYQISAPIQPGNSGSPVFNSKGELVGVTGSQLTKAENVSYATKSTVLLNLLQSTDEYNWPNTNSKIELKTLPDQVKVIKNFVYLIEVTE